MKQECSNCYYGLTDGTSENPSVVCRRYPPTVTKVEGNNVTSTYPILRLEGWCGEWRKKQSKIRLGA